MLKLTFYYMYIYKIKINNNNNKLEIINKSLDRDFGRSVDLSLFL